MHYDRILLPYSEKDDPKGRNDPEVAFFRIFLQEKIPPLPIQLNAQSYPGPESTNIRSTVRKE